MPVLSGVWGYVLVWSKPLSNLVTLVWVEQVHVDIRRVKEIVNELGELGAGNLIRLALEQIAIAVQSLQSSVQKNDVDSIATQAERLSRLAAQIGLSTLAQVSNDIARCARRQDFVAISATLARVVRTTNRSVADVWGETAY